MTFRNLQLSSLPLPPETRALRSEVRAFIAAERSAGRLEPPHKVGLGFSREMSMRIGAMGWIGMTWPKAYGGHERSALERYVVSEELLAASVSVGAHWIGDRQSGPLILRFGNEAQRLEHLPPIARGERTFCIGMSEPDSGSDLAGIRSRAEPDGQNWKINGQKLWTTNAHRADFMITLVRTSAGKSRHDGFSQFIIDLTAPGVTIRPVISMPGDHDFNEVYFDDVIVAPDALVGTEGNGWNQVSAELAYERSGPERWLSTFRLLEALIDACKGSESEASLEQLGRLVAHLMSLRQMSIAIAGMLQAGETPLVQAAMVKELGTRFEQDLVEVVQTIAQREHLASQVISSRLNELIESGLLWSPAFTIRGGAIEILRGVIARGLGLR